MNATTRGTTLSLLIAGSLLLTTGCATKKYVRQEDDAAKAELTERVDGVQTQVETNQNAIEETSQTAQEALDRAIAAGKLAEGKFLYETVLSDDQFKFAFDSADLSPEATSALDAFASKIKEQNENVFIEIQGHTDGIGTDLYNEQLGLERAEAVRRYLGKNHDFALHRMSVISYGESAPVADNGSREGRAQNRRVALVVLK